MNFFKKKKKVVAAFLLVNFLGQLAAPSVSYALTAGPTSPEATSFEPVDTTDLVDIKTGDFNYNFPLFEVPGPEGGYPLNLSYHAGIQPDQEASWVGLGWTLNTGSITRMVNGYPDDHKDVNNNDRLYWEGGQTTTKSVGISYGITNAVSISADLTFAQDTYRGMGVGSRLGVNVAGNYKGANASVGVGFGRNPYGGNYASGGANVGIGTSEGQAMKLGLNAGADYNTNTGFSQSVSAGLSSAGRSMLGASMSSNNSSPLLSVGGGTFGVNNSKSGNISTESDNFQMEVPIFGGLNLRLGRSYQRYWMDEKSDVGTFGSLYMPKAAPGFEKAFDVYDILDKDLDIVDHNDPEKLLGGSLPDYDIYTVTAQGIGGNIQPSLFRKHLYRQDKKQIENGDEVIYSKSYPLTSSESESQVEFRFLNDFSNRYEYNPGDFELQNSALKFEMAGNPTTGETGNDGFVNNKLGGSKNVEWYSNAQINGTDVSKKPFEKGFINTGTEGFNRKSDSQIGGYTVTNTSGVNYHYGLPAYSYDEYMKSQKTDQQGKISFNELKKPERYAYTWFLTAITGPDYVDANGTHKADNGDLGYWVAFDYKLLMGDYKWRNPAIGFNKDIDGEFDFFSYGKKEVYYLDKIITRTHVALFEKSERIDGREVIDLTLGGFGPNSVLSVQGKQTCLNACDAANCHQGDCNDAALQQCNSNCNDLPDDVYIDVFPRESLKLDKVKLLKYEDFIAGNLDDSFAQRIVKFNYDYSLAIGTPNSYDKLNSAIQQGKLSLQSVEFLGKGGASMLPLTSFSYAKNPAYKKDAVDMWGYYKSDYVEGDNQNITRLTTELSAQSADAWSLTSIHTSLGSKINVLYESDEYLTPSLYNKNILSLTDAVFDKNNQSVVLTVADQSIDLRNYVSLIKKSNIELLLRRVMYMKQTCVCGGSDGKFIVGSPVQVGNFYYQLNENLNEDNIIAIERNSIEYHFSQAVDDLLTTTNTVYTQTPCVTLTGQEIQPQISIDPAVIAAGNIIIPGNQITKGGGLRVKEIEVTNGVTNEGSRKTAYTYTEGSTTYEPISMGKVYFDLKGWDDYDNPNYVIWMAERDRIKKAKEDFSREVNKNFSSMLITSRVVPGPGVIYGKVNINEKMIDQDGSVMDLPNYSSYEFETFKPGMVDFVKSELQNTDVEEYSDGEYKSVKTRKISLKDYTTRIGALKSISLYGPDGIISKSENVYLHSNLSGSFEQNKEQYENELSDKFNNQGVVEETFARARIVLYKKDEKIPYNATAEVTSFPENQRDLLGVIFKKETFPSVPIAQKNVNYKTGISSITNNLKFDFYSGDVTKILESDSYGNSFTSESIPAYRFYTTMGMAINGGKNMLSQTAAGYTYKSDIGGAPLSLLSASIQTWSNQASILGQAAPQLTIWRKYSSYQWNGQQALNEDGSYPIAEWLTPAPESQLYLPFNWNNLALNTNWEKTGSITLYDVFSHALEADDINGNFAATRMDPKQVRVIAGATNAAYKEMAYSGTEYSMGNSVAEGGVDRGAGSPTVVTAHTGNYSLLVNTNMTGYSYLLEPNGERPMKKYKASVWMYVPGEGESQTELNKVQLYYSINGEVKKEAHATALKNKSKSWYLLELDIIPEGQQAINVGVRNLANRGAYFDDFRVHPLDAGMTSYVYDQVSGELSDVLDGNNFYTHYQYDAMGRLIRTTRELLSFDYGPGKESFRSDQVVQEAKYNYGKAH